MCDESKRSCCGVMYELWNDVRSYYSICDATFENECMISNHGVSLFCFFSNNVQYMFYNANAFNQNLCSWSFPSYWKESMFQYTSCPYEFNDPPEYACYACV